MILLARRCTSLTPNKSLKLTACQQSCYPFAVACGGSLAPAFGVSWFSSTHQMFRKKKQYFSETYRVVCAVVEKLATEKLGRSLSATERNGIWNAGSLMMLEVVERDILSKQSAESMAQELTESARTFERRFFESVLSLKTLLETELNRKVSESELTFIESLPNIWALMVVGEQIKDAASRKRETVFQELQKKTF